MLCFPALRSRCPVHLQEAACSAVATVVEEAGSRTAVYVPQLLGTLAAALQARHKGMTADAICWTIAQAIFCLTLPPLHALILFAGLWAEDDAQLL